MSGSSKNKKYENEYVVESIMDFKYVNHELYCLIKFEGYNEPEWQPFSNTVRCEDDLRKLQKRPLIYTRVSTKTQEISLELQTYICEKYITDKGCTVGDIFGEAKSGYKNTDKMYELHKLLDIVVDGQSIIIYSVDRFMRNFKNSIKILEALKKRNINVFSVIENINYFENKKEFRQKLKNAEAESALKSLKSKQMHQYKKENGSKVGRPLKGKKYITFIKKNGVSIKRLVSIKSHIKKIHCF